MRRIWKGQSGVTLAEVLVGIGILSLIMTTLGVSLFQALATEQAVVNDGRAINELRRGISWFAEDVMMAQTSDLADAASPTPSVTFSWTNEYNGATDAHSSGYALVDDRLVRTYDGGSHTVAQGLVSADFSRSGNLITAVLEVDAGSGTTRTLTLQKAMGAADGS